jgi:hypothetical protein
MDERIRTLREAQVFCYERHNDDLLDYDTLTATLDSIERQLQNGLIGDLVEERHVTAYRTSPWFRTAVDTLAQFLPMLIDGLAARAEEQDRDLKADAEALQRTILDPRWVP